MPAGTFEFDTCIINPDASLKENDQLCRTQHLLTWELRRLPKGQSDKLLRLVTDIRSWSEFLTNGKFVNEAVRIAMGGRSISDEFIQAHLPDSRFFDFLQIAWDVSELERIVKLRDRLVPAMQTWAGDQTDAWMAWMGSNMGILRLTLVPLLTGLSAGLNGKYPGSPAVPIENEPPIVSSPIPKSGNTDASSSSPTAESQTAGEVPAN